VVPVAGRLGRSGPPGPLRQQYQLGGLVTRIGNCTSVLIVEDNPLYRKGLHALLGAEENLVVRAAVNDVDQALDVLSSQRVDVVLYGVGDSPRSTERTLATLCDHGAPYRVVVLSKREKPGEVEVCLGSGVSAYLSNDVSSEHLVSVIRGLSVNRELIYIMASRVGIGAMGSQRGAQLSRREREIMGLVAKGLSNAAIGHRLSITSGTVKRHLRNIFVKLNAMSRIDAVNKARAAAVLV
jgi:DNA-binding NarL/FixJ family response regulator